MSLTAAGVQSPLTSHSLDDRRDLEKDPRTGTGQEWSHSATQRHPAGQSHCSGHTTPACHAAHTVSIMHTINTKSDIDISHVFRTRKIVQMLCLPY